jgi:hypothetical protein
LSVVGVTLPGMDDYAEAEDIPPGLPLSAADRALARYDVPRDLGALLFGPDDTITRSLWVVFVGELGIWTRASLPLDNRLDMGDVDDIAFMCDLTASLIEPPGCHEDEEALVVLRRPAPPALARRMSASSASSARRPRPARQPPGPSS